MTKIPKESLDLIEERKNTLKRVLPEVFTEGKLDLNKLKEALGDAVETSGERYSFNWAGRIQSIRTRDKRSKATLIPSKKESVDFDKTKNIFIEGENLEVLKILQKAYEGKVNMIYIDPPYNVDADTTYEDDFSDPLRAYLKYTGQLDANGRVTSTNLETSGRYHSRWLTKLYPRLTLARNLLCEDGVIFVSIDDREAHNLRLIMNEIFGEENFIADIVVVNNLKGRNDRRYIATAHERVLLYVKSFEFEEQGLEMSEERLREFDEEDDIGKYRTIGLRKRGGADTREKRPKMYFAIYADPKTGLVSLDKNAQYNVEILPKKSDGTEGCWRWGHTNIKLHLKALIARPVGNNGKFDVFEKDYLETNGEIRRLKPKSIMMGSNYSTDGATKAFREIFPEASEFTNPKPVPFLRDMVAYSTLPNEEHIILDFYAGSGTTAHAVLEQNADDGGNRKFILVQLPEPMPTEGRAYKAGYKTIADICKERLRRAAKKLKAEGNQQKLESNGKLDLGFKVFKLSKSNCFVWDSDEARDPNKLIKHIEESAKSASTAEPEALAFELMLREGFRLDSEIRKMKQGKNSFFKVSDNGHSLWMCFDEKIDDDAVKSLSLTKDDKLIVLDSSLSDTQKVNLARKFRVETV
ncbi:DNA methylase [Candidatus Gugararchaeum adminiculabundum]|nr:DNA methylase [Candidatus Gugararchaeum adminiculabundum]